MAQELACQTCSAPINIDNQFIRSVNCQFCGASYLISGDDGLEARGQGVKLADYPSRLTVGQTGVIRGRSFSVLGRVRYAYPEGFWEEWQIAWEDGQPPAWLEEDEGYWTLYKRERVRSQIPSHDSVRVGGTMQVNNMTVFVTEKRTGKMVGQEGQFSAVMPIAGDFGYATGTADGKPVSVTYWEDEIEVETGDDLEPHEIKLS
ncbi:MAG: hypothetical protein Phog2KO_11880 [Phototrophicaceae bacterium]